MVLDFFLKKKSAFGHSFHPSEGIPILSSTVPVPLGFTGESHCASVLGVSFGVCEGFT